MIINEIIKYCNNCQMFLLKIGYNTSFLMPNPRLTFLTNMLYPIKKATRV